MDVEKTLKKFKLLSPYYGKLFSLLLFLTATNAFTGLQYVFTVSDSEYRCKYPNCGDINMEKNLSSRLQNNCYRYSIIDENTSCVEKNIDKNKSVECTEFDYEEKDSFQAEFNLGCEDWKKHFVGSVHNFGYMAGLLIIGPLTDKLGRKNMIILTGTIAGVMGLGKSMVNSYWVYVFLELIEAMFGDNYSPTFMLGVEMVTKENRATFITLMTATTSLAGVLMAFIAWAIPYWRIFLRVIYAPCVLFPLYFFLLDESIRWLLITGRRNEAKNIIKQAAKMNNVDITEAEMDNISYAKRNEGDIELLKALKVTFSSRKLVMRIGGCFCLWIVTLFNKYVLILNSVEIEGNKYFNYGLTQLSELPASILLAYILNRFKRRIPLMISLILTGVFCGARAFVPKGYVVLSTSFFLVSKFTAAISSGILYLYTAELFPTQSRNTMHSLCSAVGRIATILAPQTPLLMQYWYGLPSLLVAILSLVTGLIVLLMPDTAEDSLPDTVIEAENVGTKEANIDIEVTNL